MCQAAASYIHDIYAIYVKYVLHNEGHAIGG